MSLSSLNNTIIFITGGSGFLGRRLITRLVSLYSPHEVRALSRSSGSSALLRSLGAVPIDGDLHDIDALNIGMKGAHVVFHCAAHVETWGPYADFHRFTVEGTANVLRAAQQQRVKRFVHVSSEAVLVGKYARPLNNVNEEYQVEEAGEEFPYSKSKAAAEVLVRNASTDSFTAMIVRPRYIWGVGDTVVLPELIKLCKSGGLMYMNHGAYQTSTVHVDNACEGMELCAVKGKANQIYFLTDGVTHSIQQLWSEHLGTVDLSAPPIWKSLPFTVMWYFAFILELLAPIIGKPMITRQACFLMGHTMVVDDSKARQQLGYTSHKSWDDGIREMREEYLKKMQQQHKTNKST